MEKAISLLMLHAERRSPNPSWEHFLGLCKWSVTDEL